MRDGISELQGTFLSALSAILSLPIAKPLLSREIKRPSVIDAISCSNCIECWSGLREANAAHP